jgi:hypothetical protein
MVLSKKTIPHAGCSVDVDRKLTRPGGPGQKKAPSYVIFAIVAVIKALKIHRSSTPPSGRWRALIEPYDA